MRPSTLLQTKFIAPRLDPQRLPRPRLVNWLVSQSSRRLMLISAPPGYGKTTLLVDFLEAIDRPYAWYQLDAADSDPTVFLTYLIEAIRNLKPTPATFPQAIGRSAQSLLDGIEASSPLRVMTVLINELSEQLLNPWLIVLEDYHDITNPEVHQLVDFLLENSPPNLSLMISTRADPPLSLARLRARGLLGELRTEDLRFNTEEVLEWLQLNLPQLSTAHAALLSERTEGWVAALHLIRSSLQGRDAQSIDQVFATLSASHRFVFEYLAEEVLRQQPPQIQHFLMCTAVLDRMDAASCNALSGRQDALAMLEVLEQRNLFLTSLDVQREWYRYHYLFREFLLSRLRREQAQQLQQFQQIAGAHFEQRGELEVALKHYLEAQDYFGAARVISAFASDYVERGRVEVLHRYLNALPPQVLHLHPDLLLQHGNVHHRLGNAGAAITAYEDARQVYAAHGRGDGVSRALTRLAEVNRAQGNYRQAELLASQALESAPQEDHAARAEALIALAKSAGFLTDMERGRALAEQAVEEARLAGEALSPQSRASFLGSLGQICWWQGDPHQAVRFCQEALRLIPDQLSPIAAQVYLSLVTPYLYWREMETALKYAEQGLQIAQTLNLKELLPSAYTVLGNVLTRSGETARAEACLRQSLEICQQLGLASYEQLMATGYLAYNLCEQGRIEEAWQLAEGALWSYTGSPYTYEAYVCRSVLADVALESNQLERAERLYSELVEIGAQRKFNIPLSLVYFGLAYIHLVTDRQASGLELARQALRLIEPSGAIQLFLDQGQRTPVVCQALRQAGVSSPFLDRVEAHLEKEGARGSRLFPTLTKGAILRVKCLGGFQVFYGANEISQERWVSTKARDLLAYFITFRRERVHVERAFDALWSERPGRGLAAFHTSLSRLRHALRGDDNAPRLILVEAGEYWLDAASFEVDVDEFDTLVAKARRAPNEGDAARCYQQAIDTYQGEYLHNLYYDWVLPERRRLNHAYLGCLRQLAEIYLTNGRAPQALDILEKALALDPLCEPFTCLAMRACFLLGDRGELRRYYQALCEGLSQELGVEPLEETTRLYKGLLERSGE